MSDLLSTALTNLSHLTCPNLSSRPGCLNSRPCQTYSARNVAVNLDFDFLPLAPSTPPCSALSCWFFFFPEIPATSERNAKHTAPAVQTYTVLTTGHQAAFSVVTWQSLHPNVIPPVSFNGFLAGQERSRSISYVAADN